VAFTEQALFIQLGLLADLNFISGELEDKLGEVGDLVVQYVQDLMESVASPSAPYGPPAIVTGALYDSYEWEITHEDGLTLEVGSYLLYSVYLEFGTYKMAPRPHLSTAFSMAVQEAHRLIGEAWVARERTLFARFPAEILIP
jgi:hypothetical protein